MFCFVLQNGWGPKSVQTFVSIFTKDSPQRQYTQYMTTHIYPQSAHTYTTENMWFPLTTDRLVYVSIQNGLIGNSVSEIYVIGYR